MSNRLTSIVLPASTLSLMLLACGSGQPTPTTGIVMTVSAWTPSPETTSPPAAGSDGECSNDYFPTDEGATWRYSTESDSADAQERTATIVATTEEGFSVELGLASGARFVIEWGCRDGDLTQLTPAATLYLSAASATVTTTSRSGVTLPNDLDQSPDWQESGSWSAGSGDATFVGSFTSTNSARGTEVVTVPFGTFEAMRVESEQEGTLNGDPVSPCQVTQWWAKDVGLIRQETTCPVGGQSMTEVLELTSYDSP